MLTLSSTKPTRSGYTFLGWSSSSSATSPTYYAGGTYTANASITLYAVWSRITYTVSYDANGGSGAPFSQIKYYGQVLTISNTVPTRDGYTFLGWSESSSAASPSYYAGGQFGDDRSVTLYAVWQEHNYDFSISALEVTPDTVTQYETVNIRFRIDSWDEYNNYSDIPVEVLLNGTQIYYTTVYIYAYGVKYAIAPEVDNTTYKITNVGASKCLNIRGNNLFILDNAINVVSWHDTGSNEQKWVVYELDENTHIRSAIDKSFGLNVYRSGSPFNCNIRKIAGNETDASVDIIADGESYKVKLHNYDLYLTVGNSNNDSNIYWDSASDSDYQKWIFTEINF